jgi:hypothetical protein
MVVVVSCDGGWLGVQLVAPVESLARKLAEAFVASGALTAQPFDTVRSLRTRPAHTPCAHALRTRPARCVGGRCHFVHPSVCPSMHEWARAPRVSYDTLCRGTVEVTISCSRACVAHRIFSLAHTTTRLRQHDEHEHSNLYRICHCT